MSLISITFATPKQESPAIAAALNKGAMDIMHWIILIVAGLCEVGFTYCLGRARTATGVEWWSWMAGFIVFTVLSMGMLAKATHHIPLGTAYPVWTSIGAIGAVLVGIFVFREPATFWRLFFLTTLIASIVGLKTIS
jgi:quaternary ammonium compound-resistance protein SugE